MINYYFFIDVCGKCKLNSKLSLLIRYFQKIVINLLTFVIKKLYLCPQIYYSKKRKYQRKF